LHVFRQDHQLDAVLSQQLQVAKWTQQDQMQ
jgi:hypothetical protein